MSESNIVYGINRIVEDNEYKESSYFRHFEDANNAVHNLNMLARDENKKEMYFTFVTTETELRKRAILTSRISYKDEHTRSLVSKLLGIDNYKIYSSIDEYYGKNEETVLDNE